MFYITPSPNYHYTYMGEVTYVLAVYSYTI